MSALDDLNARVKDLRRCGIGVDATAAVGSLVGDLIRVVNEQSSQIAALQLDLMASRRYVAKLEHKLGFPGP